MASKPISAAVFLLSLLLLSTICNGCRVCPHPPPKPKPCPTPPPPKPKPCPTPPPEMCPIDALKLGVCVDLLGHVGVVTGAPLSSKCCALLGGLADLEVALCLCTAIKANVLGIDLNIPVTLSTIISACQKTVPPGFKCP